MTDLICYHCNHTFSNKQNLKQHQSTAKYCLEKQNIIEVGEIKCNDCLKLFTTQSSLDRHKVKCKIKEFITPYKEEIALLKFQLSEKNKQLENKEEVYKNQIKEIQSKLENKEEVYKNQIKELQDKLENIALKAISRPTTTNNTTNVNAYIQQMDIITDKIFEDNLENFSIEYIKKGAEGFANYALEHPLNNRVACVDYSRKKVKYKDENGNIISDPEMMKLSMKLFSSILTKNKELITKYVDEVTYSSLNPDEKMQIMVDMTDNMFLVKRGAEGEKHQLYDAFLKNICSKTLVR